VAVPFEIVRAPAEMRARAEDQRRDGVRIAVVPTMGALHDGHLSLLRAGRARADLLIATIFVNPTQFGPGEDYAAYPRTEEDDVARARECGADLVFAPDADSMYPPGYETYVEVRELSRPLCGASRPGHFSGVATVVTKLFHTTLPHVAVFGEKDYQQLALIRRMNRDLDFGIEIVGMPIVREADGLALSSRNRYLSPEERADALSLSRGLTAAREAYRAGERDRGALEACARAPVEAAPRARLEYAELRDADTLEPVERADRPAVLAVAARVGTTRLIDNTVLGRESDEAA
jgi:pantoate--beta-alanine ligase